MVDIETTIDFADQIMVRNSARFQMAETLNSLSINSLTLMKFQGENKSTPLTDRRLWKRLTQSDWASFWV
jgi:hypothetical protein